MKKLFLILVTAVVLIGIGGIISLNFFLYGTPTPCYGKKTDWTQTEVEDHFMRRAYKSARSYGYATYEDFLTHPGTVMVFDESRSRHKSEFLKGRYVLSVWYETLKGDRVGIIREHNESFSKCLRYRGYFGYHFDPEENGYKVSFYNTLVAKKKESN